MLLSSSRRSPAPIALHAVPSLTIRPALGCDERALARLAALDSAPVPARPLLVAEVDGELRAALSHDGTAIGDPFFPTAHLIALLQAHAAAGARRSPRSRRLLRPRLA